LDVFVSSDAYDVLAETNGYPDWDILTAVIQHYNRDIQPRDVIELINALLAKVPTLEDHLLVRGLDFENAKCSPDSNLSNRSENFTKHYYRLLLLGCLMVERNATGATPWLATKGLPDQQVTAISFSADSVTELADGGVVSGKVRKVHGNVLAITSVAALLDSYDPTALWLEATTQLTQTLAVNLAIARLSRSAGLPAERGFFFGRKFFATAGALGFLGQVPLARILIRACAETVLRTNLQGVHWLRTGPGANDSQRKRGMDRAWRRDIDYTYHLHYWETPDGPEFASVVSHNDMSIPT
jgi:hypothetical protein